MSEIERNLFNKEVLKKQEQRVDEEWLSVFKEHGNWDNYSFYRQDKDFYEEQRDIFLRDRQHAPKYDYIDLKPENLNKFKDHKNVLLSLKKKVVAEINNATGAVDSQTLEKVLAAKQYRIRINEKLAEIGLLLAVAEGNERAFKHYNNFIYGEPQQNYFNYAVNSIKREVEAVLAKATDNVALGEVAKELMAELPDVSVNYDFPIPQPDSFQAIKSRILATLEAEGVLQERDLQLEGEEITSVELVEELNLTLRSIGADNWQSVVDPHVRNLITRQSQEQIAVPPDKFYSRKRATELKVHEAGTHVQRRIKGEQSRLGLLGMHLDRDEAGEEGAATVRTQILEDQWQEFSGIERYFACGMASGGLRNRDGNRLEAMDFSALFSLMNKYYQFMELVAGERGASLSSHEEIENKTYDFCVRIFRSPNPNKPGLISTKDTKYLEGNIKTWAKLIENPELAEILASGKFDITNPKHVELVKIFKD